MELRTAQRSAPFTDQRGLPAATLAGQHGGPTGIAPVEQCLTTPFQCIPERSGWRRRSGGAVRRTGNELLAPQVAAPTQTGEWFVVDDWNNKVTETDQGANYFSGNSG